MEVTGLTKAPAIDNVEGIVVCTGVEKAGEFSCSDERINRIHDTVLWTQISNLHGIPTDCPAREKCGWLGDAQIIAESTIYNFDMALFWEKYLWDIETSRQGGMPFDIAPGKRLCSRGIPDWSTAMIQIPWYLYLYYGDVGVLRSHYPGMQLVMENFRKRSKDWILYEGRGDWCPPGSIVPVETPMEVTSTEYFYLDALIMERTAVVLGKEKEAREYTDWKEQIKRSFLRGFYDREKNTYGSQTADSFALYLGLVPDGMEKVLAASLARDVAVRHNGHASTGITGNKYLYHALGNYDYGSLAYHLFRNDSYPGIGYLFSQGATTLWETWEETAYSKHYGKDLFRSMNHPMQSGFDSWFYQGLAGICPDPEKPGFKGILLKPEIVDEIPAVRATYRSVYGPVVSNLTRNGRTLEWEIGIPANTTAKVFFPVSDPQRITEIAEKNAGDRNPDGEETEDGRVVWEIGSGKHRYRIALYKVRQE